MGRSKGSVRQSAAAAPATIDECAKQRTTKTGSGASKVNRMQSEVTSGRRQQNRKQKARAIEESETSSSPADVDQVNDTNATAGNNGTECRRSSRKKTIKFDVRDLLNKNRKSHKIQIEARIDSNAPKPGAGQPSKEEINSKQKTFNEKSEIFRRYSISENRLPPRPPPPAVLIQKIQQCVGELEQLPLDGGIDMATISPIARRLSRTQEILTASMMKPKQVSSLIVTKLESATPSRASPTNRGKVGRPKLTPKSIDAIDTTTMKIQKRRGRPPKFKQTESAAVTTESSNDSLETVDTDKPNPEDELDLQPSTSNKHEQFNYEENFSNGRQFSISPDSSTKGIDLKEMLDASAVTLPQPTIPDDCMLVSTDDLFIAAEEEVFTQAVSSDESTVLSRDSPKDKESDEVSLFARSDSTETNSSDDSERRRRKVRVSVKRFTLPSTIRERLESTSKCSSSDEKSDVIEISSNDSESARDGAIFNDVVTKMSATQPIKNDPSTVVVRAKRMSPRKPTGSSPTELVISNSTLPLAEDNSNSNFVGSIVEISSESTTPVKELLVSKSPSRPISRSQVRGGRRDAVEKLKNEEAAVETKRPPDLNEKEQSSASRELPNIVPEQDLGNQTEKKLNSSEPSSPENQQQPEKGKRRTRDVARLQSGEKDVEEKTVPVTRSQRNVAHKESDKEKQNSVESVIEEKPVCPAQDSTTTIEQFALIEQTQPISPRSRQKNDDECKQDNSLPESIPTRKTLRSAETGSPSSQPKTPTTRGNLRKVKKSVSNSDTETATEVSAPIRTPTLRSKANTNSTSPTTQSSSPTTSHKMQDSQKGKPKGRQKSKKDKYDGDQEETSSVHSESSLTSSSSSSIISSSPSSTSSATSSTSNSQVRVSRSKALQQLSLDSTPRSKRRSNATTESSEIKTPIHHIPKKPFKLEEELFTEPDSESSENSGKKNHQPLKDARDSNPLLKERAKLIQRRKSARLSHWTNLGEEISETSSESSETYLPVRKSLSGRFKEFSMEENPPNTEQANKQIETTTQIVSVPCETKDIKTDDTQCENSAPSDQSPRAQETIHNKSSQQDEKHCVKSGRSSNSNSASKPRRVTRKFAPLKDNSSDATESTDATALSDAEMPSSTRTLRHTRARRKTISSENEFAELFTTNLSPPDKAIEYKSKVKLCKSINEVEKIESKRIAVSEEQAELVNDPLVKVPEHVKESKEVSKIETVVDKNESVKPVEKELEKPDEKETKLETTTQPVLGEAESVVDNVEPSREQPPEDTPELINATEECIKPELQQKEENVELNKTIDVPNTPEMETLSHAADKCDIPQTTVSTDPKRSDDHDKKPPSSTINDSESLEQSEEPSVVPAPAAVDTEESTKSIDIGKSIPESLIEETKKSDEMDSAMADVLCSNDKTESVPALIADDCENVPKPSLDIRLDSTQEVADENNHAKPDHDSVYILVPIAKLEETDHKEIPSIPEPEATANIAIIHTPPSKTIDQQPISSDKSHHKKDVFSPSKKKKHQSRSHEFAKSNGDESRRSTSQKKTKPPPEENKELVTKPPSVIPIESEISAKAETNKPEPKPTPRRQLDSSFIKSLEKSLLSAKKSSKKRDSSVKSTTKEKEESCKPKQSQEHHKEEKKTDTPSPKPRIKHKELSKSDKGDDDDGNKTKRKSLKKLKEPEPEPEPELDAPKQSPTTTEPPINKPPLVTIISEAPATPVEPQPQLIPETPTIPIKTVKSKGETKFYPAESLLLTPESMSTVTSTASSSLSTTPKEKSPESMLNPLKDIEKFIEDGENLLKRGFKLDEEEVEAAGLDGVIQKTDDTITTTKKSKLDDNAEEKKPSSTSPDDDNSNSNSESSILTTILSSETDAPNGIRRSHRIKNNSKSSKCLVGRGLVRDKERFSTKDDEKTIYSIDDQKMDLAEVEAKNSKFLKDMEESLSNFRVIRENEYKCERVISKEAKRMICDCFLTQEEEERGELGCGEDCLNRLLMIECGSDCTVRDRCTNRRFVKFLYSPCRVFRTEKKGFGIMADIEILPGEFIMEYVGEVINGDEFERRRNAYSEEKNKHYYFMALRSDAIIDATAKGNISRFINHSCDPNAETQKWTVNGELRIGFFSKKNIMPGEEITFDYQYQRYGKEAQKCFCESANCRGWIGAEPSSEEEEEDELDEDEEGESEELEEEEERLVMSPAVPTPIAAPTPTDEQSAAVPAVISDITTDVDKDAQIQPTSVPTPIAAQTAPKIVKDPSAKKKKEKKRLVQRTEEKIKRREAKQFLEDPDIEDEVRFLSKCGLRNQADTLRLSRLMVRAKLLQTRLKLLQILRSGELPCRRLFLDYHGLRLLHGWMSEVIDSQDTDKGMEIRMALLNVLECLPISNKTMLTDSKVYQTVRDWSNNKESHSPNDESPKDSIAADNEKSSPSPSSSELQKLATKLVSTWDNLPEIFRIPKRERIEQMKEHEREADRQYKALGEDSKSVEDRSRERFIRNSGPKGTRFKWSRSEKDRCERERTGDRRRYAQGSGSSKDGSEKSSGTLPGDPHLSKEQRRELFAAKVARDEAEKRLAEERREFDVKCRFFGLDPKRMRPENMPFCVNPSTGQWYSTNRKPIATPPSYAHVQVPVKPKSTDPNDYRLPQMDLPPFWKFAISPKGKIYYYHVKIRIPQWEPPIKILPLAGQLSAVLKNSESDSSNADCVDSSEDDIEVIKGLDPVKLQAFIEKKIEDRRLQRYNRLVEEKPISPRKEEDRIYNQMEVRKYKENKEKIRKRKEEIRRRRESSTKGTSAEPGSAETAESEEPIAEAVPIQDYLLSSDEEDTIKAECNNSPLIDKIVHGDKIVDELDALQSKRPFKRPLPIREKYEHKKRKLEKSKDSSKSSKRSKDGEGSSSSSSSSSSSKYRKIREKFRCEIAGIIVHHLKPYRKETCLAGRILSDDDFNHLARKLTHFVMVKELKYCESIGQTLVVTESVKNKSREFIKKYMAKYDAVYVRPKNDPEFKEIPSL